MDKGLCICMITILLHKGIDEEVIKDIEKVERKHECFVEVILNIKNICIHEELKSTINAFII